MENPFINNNRSQVSLNQFFARIYGIVGIGVAVSALTSFLTINILSINSDSKSYLLKNQRLPSDPIFQDRRGH